MALLAALRSVGCSGSNRAALSVLQAQLPIQTLTFGSQRLISSNSYATPDSRKPHSLPKRVAWIHEALALVRSSEATAQKPLVKDHLWKECEADDSCSLPTRRVLSDSLNWLRQNKYLQTAKSDLGSKKYPRFGYYVRPDAPSSVTEANQELIDKWATYCHRQPEGHKRAVMVSDQATTLARALADGRGLHSTEKVIHDRDVSDEDDAWRQEDYAASSLPEKEQVQLRLAKGISHEQAALQRNHREIELVKHTHMLLDKMAPIAAKKLTRLHMGDYNAQVDKQLSNLQLRQDKLKSDATRHGGALNQYTEWQEILSEGSLAELHRALTEKGMTLSSIFPEASRKLPMHMIRAELPEAKSSAVREAQDAVAKTKWTAAKAVKIGERMVKVAKSADERAYADRMLKQGAMESAETIQRAETELAHTTQMHPRTYMSRAIKQVAGQGRAWHQQYQAAAEMRLRQEYVQKQADRNELSRGKDMRHTKKITTRKNIRTSGAAVKRAVRDNYSYQRLEKEVSHKRWQKEGRRYVDQSSTSRLGSLR